MTQLTENDIRPVPQFVDSEPTVNELNALSGAIHALQRVAVFQHQEIARLEAEVAKATAEAPKASTRKTASTK